MIKTEDLRRRNLISDSEGNIIVVHTISESVINESWTGPLAEGVYQLNPGHGEEDIDPIPLTIEWLEKLGFEWRAMIHRWIHPTSRYTIIEHAKGFSNGFGNGEFLKQSLKYVHQLQNVYYMVVGEELTIKTPDEAV